MCRYCNYESDDNRIFIDPLTNEYYLDIETMIWDSDDDDFPRGYVSFYMMERHDFEKAENVNLNLKKFMKDN